MTGVTETQWQRRLLEHLRFLAEEALAPDLFDRLVARLYEDWPCAIAILSYEPDQQFSNQGATWGFDEALLHQFRLHYYAVNPYPEVVVANGLLNATANIETYFPRPRLWKTEYYNDFMRPQCLEHVMALSIDFGRSARTSVSFYRGEHEGGAFTREEVRRLEMLRPHLRQTLLLRRLWRALTADSLSDPGAFEHLSSPVLLVDGDAVRPLNAAGDDSLREGARMTSGGKLIPFREGRLFPLADPKPAGPMVLIQTPDQSLTRAATRWQLTERESQILRSLQDGLSAREIAAGLGIAVSTVQTHVKSIHRKSGFGSTAKLLREMARHAR